MALNESVAKSRERNTERNKIGETEKNSREEMGTLRYELGISDPLFSIEVKRWR